MTSYGLDEWFWAMFEPTWTCPNFTIGQLFMWIGANNDQIWLPMGWMSDSEHCSNRLELDLISLLVNFACELGQIMTRYDFLWARWMILINVRTDAQLGQIIPRYDLLGLDEWFWAMFKPTPTWPNFDFGKLFIWTCWIGANRWIFREKSPRWC